MLALTTPRTLDRFGEFYHQIGGLLTSGVTLVQGLELIRAAPPSAAFRAPLDRLLEDLRQGFTFAEALARRTGWLPDFDVALIAAGEKSGRLDACCQRLSEYYRDRAKLLRAVLTDLAYPAFLILLLLLIFPPSALPRLVWQGDVAGFVAQKLTALMVLGGASLVVFLLNQSTRTLTWRSLWEQLLHRVPLLGRARRSLALARLTLALEALLNAGVHVLKAWELAAAASGSPAVSRATAQALHGMAAGETPGEAIGRTGLFPGKFLSVYRSGEVSGRLDQSLNYLGRDYTEEASRLYRQLAEWTPRLVVVLIAGLIGYYVISFWSGYFGGLLDALDGATRGE